MSKIKVSKDVEALVTWALLEQGLGWASGQSSDAGLAELGTRVDTSGMRPPSIALQTDDDAHVVLATIIRLPDEARALVLHYGRVGQRPDWCEEGEGEYVQRRAANGKLAWLYEKPGDRRSKKTPIMEWQGWRPEQVAFWRAKYTLWRQALVDMVDPLNKDMQNHVATGPKAPAAPWKSGVPTIFSPDGKALTRKKEAVGYRRSRRGYVNIDGEMRSVDD